MQLYIHQMLEVWLCNVDKISTQYKDMIVIN